MTSDFFGSKIVAAKCEFAVHFPDFLPKYAKKFDLPDMLGLKGAS